MMILIVVSIIKIVYILLLSLFVFVFVADYIEINFRHLMKPKEDRTESDYKI